MKILELFSGYGTASFALKRLGVPYELVGYSDIDKYANQCFQQNHSGQELGDVTKIDEKALPDFDLLTGGFPCQAFSVAGKMQGEADPRGSLFYEIIRIAEHKKPKYMLLENVKGLTSKKFKDTFDKILSELDRIGYDVHWKVLNSKEHGIPQSRARVWFVCFRKDLNRTEFQFPEPVELKIFIKDILEPVVDSKYYLSEKLQERFAKYLEEKNKKLSQEEPISNTLSTVQKDNLVIAGYLGERFGSCNTVLSPDSMSQTLSASMGLGGGYVPKIYDRKGFDSRTKGFRESELSPTLLTKMETGGNNVPMVMQLCGDRDKPSLSIKKDVVNSINANPMSDRQQVIANCLDANMHKGIDPVGFYDKSKRNVVMNTITQAVGRYGHSREELEYINNVGKLRRLTPKECFRLMGFLNDEINIEGLSDTQRYKLAGNGQDVNMVSLLFKEMFKEELNENK